MANIQDDLDYVEAVARYFLEMGDLRSLSGDLEEGLQYTHVAATILSKQNRLLSSTQLEANLRGIAEHLMDEEGSCASTRETASPSGKCLHVLSEALPAGGLTAMAIRWIRSDCRRSHSVALLSSDVPIPEDLVSAVKESGGVLYIADQNASALQRARWLRTLAHETAEIVVLHVDVSDVTCGAAFGVDGGPPVLLVNHTAHTFWAGGTIADLVVNCRGSALEQHWTINYRGISRCATIPIPLLTSTLPEPAASGDGRGLAKDRIGIPRDAVVILTVGASFKYSRMRELDFVAVYESILKEVSNAFLVVVGFNSDERWDGASRRVGSRIRVLGTLCQSDLATVHEAADIYVEGFPFGTTTALLEAGLKGIPVVLAPSPCHPPYSSDGVALDDKVARASTVEQYKRSITELCRSPNDRLRRGNQVRDEVRKHHTGIGWTSYLEEAIRRLPNDHSIQSSVVPTRTPKDVHEYWAAFLPSWTTRYEETLDHAIVRALLLGLRPRLTPPLLRVHKEFRLQSSYRTVPTSVLRLLCAVLLPHIPATWGLHVFRVVFFLSRGAVLTRLVRKSGQRFGVYMPKTAYSEYRDIQGAVRFTLDSRLSSPSIAIVPRRTSGVSGTDRDHGVTS